MTNRKLEIIVATSSEELKTFLRDAFQKIGWVVHGAKDGLKSLQLVRKHDPDIIVMDIEMPVRDGITACRIIKNDLALGKNYPVILMGDSPDRKKIIRAIESGCDDFIIKPFNFDVLFSKVSSFVAFYQKKEKTKEDEFVNQEEAEIVIYSKQVIEKTFSNAMHGKLFDYQVVQNVVTKMKAILHNEKTLPMAFKMKSYHDYTYIHSINVASLCMSFAFHLKWGDSDLQLIGEGGFLHDLGKTKVDLKILMKPEKLTVEEFLEMKKHPVYAKDLLVNKNINEEIMKVPLEHHEHIDGNGYPNKLHDKQISKYGKLAAIVDVYDALTTDRCYHKGIDSTEAVDVMAKVEGQFDPDFFDVFRHLIRSETLGK